MLCKELPNETVEKPNFQTERKGSAGFLSLRAVGQVVGVWKGLDQRPKYVNFADTVYQSE